jgi:hypothetical protein
VSAYQLTNAAVDVPNRMRGSVSNGRHRAKGEYMLPFASSSSYRVGYGNANNLFFACVGREGVFCGWFYRFKYMGLTSIYLQKYMSGNEVHLDKVCAATRALAASIASPSRASNVSKQRSFIVKTSTMPTKA